MLADDYLQQRISLKDMLQQYEKQWNDHFSKRLQIGRFVQSHFGKEWQTNLFIGALKKIPWLTKRIIKATHGENF
ncbi:hypothetical protein [Niabella ginsengisoli]|uniref:FAD-binding domain-containing protein n=1 Tax=Niabella ginsengisoli TaxID=522298 RepID=A0ABS9SJL6_9BACT|nr:hypothetical protein [Niabella ginsengisoli]MCH5598510.1 hypothetical protein [Niabella ginsengisoli]